MIKLNLSKQELKYRTKFIQEHHYNKSEQRQLDAAIIRLNISYKELYFNVRRGERYSFMAIIACNRATRQFGKLGMIMTAATMAITSLGNALKSYAEREEEKHLEELKERLKKEIVNFER